MPSPLLATIQTFVPFWGDVGDRTAALRALRFSLLLIAALNPLFWGIYRAAHAEAFDPLWIRILIVGLSMVGLVATYRVRGVSEHPRATLVVLAVLVLVWYGVLAAANGLEPDFAIGYLFVDLAVAMLFSLVWDRPGPLAAILGVAAVIGVGVAASVEPAVAVLSPSVFLLILGAGSLVVFCAFYGRLHVLQALRTSEARLSEAERLARTGAWSLEFATGRREWSEGAYNVLGVDPSIEAPPSLLDLIVPEDRPGSELEKDRLLAEGTTSVHRFRVRRPDGEVRWLHSIAELERDRSGEPVGFRGVFLDVTDQVARLDALAKARDQAEAASRAKGEFLANMSHEIRTPLTSIIGFAQLLGDEVGAEHGALVAPIEAGAQRLLGTLNSVLDLARLEAGPADLVVGAVDVGAEVAEVAALFRPQADAQGVALRMMSPPDAVHALADCDALGRVLANLVSNAVKFTESGGVTIALREAGSHAEVDVVDTGRGMDAAFLAELFEPFHQASTGWGRSHEGTGLGLAIARRLVEAMDGTITVESQPGRGTRFTVRLPRAPHEDAVCVTAPVTP